MARGTVRDIIDAFDTRQFTKVEEYLQNLASNNSGKVFFSPVERDIKQLQIDRAFPFLNDIGAGPITQGLNALQAMSDVIGGMPLNSLRIFNRNPMVYSPNDMKTAEERFSLIIVLENLGMFDYYNRVNTVSSTEVEDLRILCLKIAKRIKSGAFNKAEFENQTINICKKVIRIGLNGRVNNG